MSRLLDGVHFDWLAGTFPVQHFSTYQGLLEFWFGRSELCGRARHYGEGLQFGEGVFLFRSPDRPEAFLEVKGGGLERLSVADQREFFCQLQQKGEDADCPSVFKATRLDIAFDDYDRAVDVEFIAKHYVDTRRYGPFRVAMFIKSSGDQSGSSVYFGRRGKLGGGCQVCIYDKCAESAGVTDSVRYEVRFYKERAHAVFDGVLASLGDLDSFLKRIASVIGGAVTFYEDDDRRVVAPFWLTFC